MNPWEYLSANAGSGTSGEANFDEGIMRMMNKRNLYVRLLTAFQSTYDLTALRDAVAGCDAEKIRMEAHALKGVTANLGLTGLSAKASNLDHAVRDGHMDQIALLMERIEESYIKTLDEIAAYIAE